MKRLESHPIADIFPLMEGAEFEALKADIVAHGLREPIRVYQGKVLDGRNRYRACLETGVEPITMSWAGKDPLAFVVSLNLHRRHLSESQRAIIAAAIANLGRGRPPENAPIGAFSQERVAEQLKVGRRQVQRARKVLADGVPELAEVVRSGEVSVAAAAEVAGLPRGEQSRLVARGPEAVQGAAAKARGTSRVNGVLAPDPPDVAAARAAGRLAPDVVPEVVEPGPEPEATERGSLIANAAATEAELDDAAWLATLPVREALPEGRRRKFDADALDYRHLEPHRKAFQHHARRTLRGGGEYAYRTTRFLRTDHPRHWLACPAPAHGGCGGTGEVPLIGACPKCRGRGYWVK